MRTQLILTGVYANVSNEQKKENQTEAYAWWDRPIFELQSVVGSDPGESCRDTVRESTRLVKLEVV